MTDDLDARTIYRVVVNHEEQYSIWPVGRELPAGWTEAGKTGTEEECLAYIDVVWTDMRPLSLRKHMAEMARTQAQESVTQDQPGQRLEKHEPP